MPHIFRHIANLVSGDGEQSSTGLMDKTEGEFASLLNGMINTNKAWMGRVGQEPFTEVKGISWDDFRGFVGICIPSPQVELPCRIYAKP